MLLTHQKNPLLAGFLLCYKITYYAIIEHIILQYNIGYPHFKFVADD